jgi:hypothetical protein
MDGLKDLAGGGTHRHHAGVLEESVLSEGLSPEYGCNHTNKSCMCGGKHPYVPLQHSHHQATILAGNQSMQGKESLTYVKPQVSGAKQIPAAGT